MSIFRRASEPRRASSLGPDKAAHVTAEASGDLAHAPEAPSKHMVHAGEDPSALLRTAILVEELGDAAARAAAWEDVLLCDPDSVSAHRRLADLKQWADPVGALRHLDQVLALAPAQLSVPQVSYLVGMADQMAPVALRHWLADQLLSAGRDGEALVQLKAAATVGKAPADWRKLAALAARLREVDEEASAWRGLLTETPVDTSALERLAQLHLEAGEPGKAVAHLEALSIIRPDDTALLRRLAETQGVVKAWPGLADTLDRLHRAQPGDANVLWRLGDTLVKSGEASRALPILREALANGAEPAGVLKSLALAATKVGDLDGAMETWRELLATRPADLDARRRLAELLEQAARPDQALEQLRMIAAQDSTDLASRKQIAEIAASTGDLEAELAALREVVAADPDQLDAHKRLAGLMKFDRPKAALVHIAAIARLSPRKIKAWQRLGKYLQDADQNEEAIKAWAHCLTLSPDDPEIHRRLADLHLATGEYRAALRRLNTLRALDSEVAPAVEALVAPPPPLEGAPLVSAVILSLDGAERLDALFKSLHATNTYSSLELIVIDHNSKDHTARVLDAWEGRLPIRRIMRDDNYSYSASCNLGVREARGDLILLLNNDIQFTQDLLGEMVRHLTPGVGIVGLKQFNNSPMADELLQPYHIGVRFQWDGERGWLKPRHVAPSAIDRALAMRPARMPAVTAAVLLCRREDYLAVAGLDEGYWYGLEDVDFCLKVRLDLGLDIVSLNSHAVHHAKSATRRQSSHEDRNLQNAANEKLYRERWTERSEADHLSRIFSDDGSHRGRVPTVAFGLDADSTQAACAAAFTLGEALTARFGWNTRYLIKGEAGWNDGGGIDALIAPKGFGKAQLSNPERFLVEIGLSAEAIVTAPDQLRLAVQGAGEPIQTLARKLQAVLPTVAGPAP